MEQCKKCWILKPTPGSKCLCWKPKKTTGIAQISPKKKERLKKQWSESDVFKKIHKHHKSCMICGKTPEPTPACFPHILPKGTYPELRYLESNIWFVCGIDCHNEFDARIRKFKRKKGLLFLKKSILDGAKVTQYLW